jgi:Bacterial Ig-like domain (group 3)
MLSHALRSVIRPKPEERRRSRRTRRKAPRFVPQLVALEDRLVPSGIRLTTAPYHVAPPKTGDAAVPPAAVVVSTLSVTPETTAALPGTGQAPGTAAALTLGASFRGIGLQDEYNQGGGTIPPDTMGVVGPSQFVEMINGQFAVYTKTGTLIHSESLDQFWSAVKPALGTTDPHLFFDKHSGRWFASTIDLGVVNPTTGALTNNDLLIAVSKTSDPTGGFIEYKVPAASASTFADYDTLGVDDNGVYFGATIFTATSLHSAIYATPKAPILAGGAITVFKFDNITDMEFSPQPSDNFDTVGPSGPAWFVASSTVVPANVEVRTLTWYRGVPTLSNTQTVLTPSYGNVFPAPSPGAESIDTDDDRLLMAIIRDNRLFTTRNVGVNSAGTQAHADRDAAEYLELNLTGASAALRQSGRAFDTAASNPLFFYYPSLTVNKQGYLVMGFTGSSITQFASSYATARQATDPAGKLGPITLLKAGEGSYTITFGSGFNRWGDYSYTSLDPTDDKTIWTIQEYAATPGPLVGDSTSRWGTWVSEIVAPKLDTRTVITSSANPSTEHAPVTFTATVQSLAPGVGVPTGTVTFTDTFNGKTKTLGTAPVGALGKATFSTSSLESGNHAIIAVYSGNSDFNGSTSQQFGETIRDDLAALGTALPTGATGAGTTTSSAQPGSSTLSVKAAATGTAATATPAGADTQAVSSHTSRPVVLAKAKPASPPGDDWIGGAF